MTSARNSDIADRMFAAIEVGDGATLAGLWSDDVTVWRLGGGPARDKARALKVIAWFVESTTDRRYEVLDRQVFLGGFVQQHTVHAADTTGTPLSFRACLVVKVSVDGLITRIDEYLDPADLAPLMRPTIS
ncbi:MAG: nuclear transport factor 2 family protein [Mycobacteriaceae bacterium]|jgi:ketosteroid isomerase-like protein